MGRPQASREGSSRPLLRTVLDRIRDPSLARPDCRPAEELDAEVSRLYRRDRVIYLGVLIGIGAIWIVGWSSEVSGGPIPVSIVVTLSSLFTWTLVLKDVLTAAVSDSSYPGPRPAAPSASAFPASGCR